LFPPCPHRLEGGNPLLGSACLNHGMAVNMGQGPRQCVSAASKPNSLHLVLCQPFLRFTLTRIEADFHWKNRYISMAAAEAYFEN